MFTPDCVQNTRLLIIARNTVKPLKAPCHPVHETIQQTVRYATDGFSIDSIPTSPS